MDESAKKSVEYKKPDEKKYSGREIRNEAGLGWNYEGDRAGNNQGKLGGSKNS